MGIPYPYSSSVIPISISTCSIGPTYGRNLRRKLEAAQSAGFDAVEIAMPDLLTYGSYLKKSTLDPSDYNAIIEIASIVKTLTREVGIRVLMLKPFLNFEGWRPGSQDSEREGAFARARGWLKVMEYLGTDMLQVCHVFSIWPSLIH